MRPYVTKARSTHFSFSSYGSFSAFSGAVEHREADTAGRDRTHCGDAAGNEI
jgi:hypothetical protein